MYMMSKMSGLSPAVPSCLTRAPLTGFRSDHGLAPHNGLGHEHAVEDTHRPVRPGHRRTGVNVTAPFKVAPLSVMPVDAFPMTAGAPVVNFRSSR